MFNQSKYTNTYYRIVERARERNLSGFSEEHHIIPKSLGGTNDSSNLVTLTPREHYICHALLVRMVELRPHLYKMMSAFNMMCVGRLSTRYTSRLYEYNKIKYYKLKAEVQRGRKRTQESRQKQSETTRGVPWSERRRNSKMHKPTAKPVLVYDSKTKAFIGQWESISLCSLQLKLDPTTVWKICEGKISRPAPNGKVYPMKTHKGYTFTYA